MRMQAYIQESFSVVEGEEILVARKKYDADNLLIEFEDFWEEDAITTRFNYDELKRLIQSTEYQEGTEISKTCYAYDEAGEIIEETIEVNGYLFERHVLEKTPAGFNRKTFQDDLILEEVVRENKDENTFEERIYHSGDLVEHHFVQVFPVSMREVSEIYLVQENKRAFVEERFDIDGNIVYHREVNEKQQVITEYQSEIQNGLCIQKTMIHHIDQNEIGIEKSEFDVRGNLTRWIKQDRNGIPLESEQIIYDAFNRPLSHISVRKNQKKHLIMRYQDI